MMKKSRTLTALLVALVLLLNGVGARPAAASVDAGGQARADELEQAPGEDSPPDGTEDDPADGDAHQPGGADEDPQTPVDPDEEPQDPDEPEVDEPDPPLADDPELGVEAAPPADGYAFVVAEPGSAAYRPWEDLVAHNGDTVRLEWHFARIVDGEYELLSADEPSLGIDFAYTQHTEAFSLDWTGAHYELGLRPAAPGTHTIEITYTHPDTGATVSLDLTLNVVESEYELVIVDPDGALRPWDEPSVKLGGSVRHAVGIARVEADGYRLMDLSPDQLQLGLIQSSNNISLFWEDGSYWVDAHPTVTGVFWRDAAYNHPDTGERVEIRLHYTCWQYEYTVVVSEPGSGDYRPWDHPIVPLDTVARYKLDFARVVDGSYEILHWAPSSSQLAITMAHFSMEWEEYDDRYLEVHPQAAGAYTIPMYFTHPETRLRVDASLSLYAMDEDPEDSLFLVGGPDHSLLPWREGQTGAAALHFFIEYNPTQTFRVFCREEWTLHDPEGILRLVSQSPGEAVFAVERTSWEEPFEFRSGNTVMTLYALLPPTTTTVPVVYDESLKSTPERMTYLPREPLETGQEVKVAIRYFDEWGWSWLVTNPLDLVRIDGAAEAWAEPGAEYFTLVPQAPGELGILVQRGRLTKVNVNFEKSVEFGFLEDNHYLKDGFTLLSSVRGRLLYDGELLELAHAIRSSNPEVISVATDPEHPSQFVLRPVGLGEARIYLDSDRYHGEITLHVSESDVPLTIKHCSRRLFPALPSLDIEEGRRVLPETAFEGTADEPFVLPYLSQINIDWPTRGPYLSMEGVISGRFTSSDPDTVRVIPSDSYRAFLEPLRPGVCTITYREGPIVKEVVVRSEPDALDHVGSLVPGFKTYYGSAEVHVESVSLHGGLPMEMGVSVYNPWGYYELENLDPAGFRFTNPGVARVEIAGRDRINLNLFNLVPLGEGSTTLTYTTQSGAEFTLAVSVGLPESVWAFVTPDETEEFGYRLWDSERTLVGESREEEVRFARVVLADDGRIHSLAVHEFPADMAVEAQDHSAFDLVAQGDGWTFRAAPAESGEYRVAITATPPGAAAPQTWTVVLYASRAVEIGERSVAAINRAIRTASVVDGYETVILLPPGYIPMDYNTPVILDRPVTLRGRDTVLASEVVVMCQTPGAKLQDLTIRFDDASFCDPTTRFTYLYLFPGTGGNGSLMSNTPYNAVYGNGIITLEDCVLDAGTGRVPPRTGVGVQGGRVTFRGANTIRGFTAAGFIVESTPGPRRYFRGLTFENNRYAVDVKENGSIDPYFIRLTESNFINNHENVLCAFPVNFSHNYFEGGNDDEHIVKSPQYTARLAYDRDNPDYPPLFIEERRLDRAELLNFEGQAAIATDNFAAGDGPVRITVRELDSSGVGEADSSAVLLQWAFAPAEPGADAPLFLPSAHIDEALDLPPDSGIERYQGIRFSHHGPLPLEGAEISVRKEVLFGEETLHLYRLADGALTYLGEVDNTRDEFYTFFLDRCSDYIITNVAVEEAGSGGDSGHGNEPGSERTTDYLAPPESQADTASGDDSGHTPGAASAPSHTPPVGAAGQRAPITSATDEAAPASGQAPSGTAFDYSYIPAPVGAAADVQRLSANRYVDDAAVRAAFAAPRDGRVVIDVGVKTVVSPLAFELLAENPTLDLVLKGDGYEWRFSAADLEPAQGAAPFDTAVHWQAEPDGAYARLAFAAQQALPGRCVLELETDAAPRAWAAYDSRQNVYAPCSLSTRHTRRLQLDLEVLREYAAIL